MHLEDSKNGIQKNTRKYKILEITRRYEYKIYDTGNIDDNKINQMGNLFCLKRKRYPPIREKNIKKIGKKNQLRRKSWERYQRKSEDYN